MQNEINKLNVVQFNKTLIDRLEHQEQKYMGWINAIQFETKLYAMFHYVALDLIGMRNSCPTNKEIKFSLMGHLDWNYRNILYSDFIKDESNHFLYEQIKQSLLDLCHALNIKVTDDLKFWEEQYNL